MENLPNLAGVKGCDVEIRKELKRAGITKLRRVPFKDRDKNEVPTSVTGLLTKDGKVVFKLTRLWYYWVVEGFVPLDVARVLYKNPIGREDVRVDGHCGRPSPEEWAFPKEEVLYGLGIYKKPDKKHPYGQSPTYGELAEMCNSGKIDAPRFVDTYHIDSQEGLDFFVQTIRAHGLID